ncbi:B2 protein, partial [Gonioctena quinquepunctata]
QNPRTGRKAQKLPCRVPKQITIDPQLVAKARQGDFSEEQVLKDYLLCVGKSGGLINDNGEIQKDYLLKNTLIAAGNVVDAEKLLDACAVQQENGPETTLHVVECYYEKSPQHINIL